jgi:WD40 repeat protein
MSFSSDGRYLASTGSFDATVRVWEVETGLPLKVLKGLKDAPIVAAWSPDGSLLAAGTIESGYISIWKIATSTLVKTISAGKTIVALAFSPDGQTLACGVSQVGVQFRSSAALEVQSSIDLTGQDARALSWSADGKHLYVAASKNSLDYDVSAKKIARRYDWPAANLARHGTRAAVTSPAGKMYDLESGKPGVALPVGQAVAGSNDGKSLYVLSGEQVLRVDPAKGTETKRWTVAASGTAWWFPGRAIFTGIGTLEPKLWDVSTGKLLHTLKGHTAGVTTMAWSPGGKVLATGGYDKTVRVWNPATGKLLRTLTGFEGAVTALAVGGDGKIAAGSADKKVRLFALEAIKPYKTVTADAETVKAVAWAPDGRLASGGADPKVLLWAQGGANPGKDKPLFTLDHPGSVECLAFSPNGKFLAAGASELRVRVWSYPGRKMLHEFTSGGSPPAVSALAWSPDATQLLAGRANHTLQLWDLKLGKEKQSIGVLAPVQSVAWAAGGRIMATCTIDRCVRFWSPTNGQIQTTVVAEKDQVSGISTEGHYRIANESETELVCVVLTAKGMDTLTPKGFSDKYGWKNNPARARLTGN